MTEYLYSHDDINGDSPGPRIGGAEREYGVNDSTGKQDVSLVNKLVLRSLIVKIGIDKHVNFLSTGQKYRNDVGQAEVSTNEVAGPLAIIDEISKADQMMFSLAQVDDNPELTGYRQAQAKADKPIDPRVESKLTRHNKGISVYNRTGHINDPHHPNVRADAFYSARGDHDNVLTIPNAVKDPLDIEFLKSILATRPLYAGAGMLWVPNHPQQMLAYRLSQKAYDTGLDHDNESATESRRKPMLRIHGPPGGYVSTDGSSSLYYPRVETRCTDAVSSEWSRWMGFAVLSLGLRILEHKNIFSPAELKAATFSSSSKVLHRVSADMEFKNQYKTADDNQIDAINHLKHLGDLFTKLSNNGINLENDEVMAIPELFGIADKTKHYKQSARHPIERDESLLSGHLDWAARLEIIKNMQLKRGLGHLAITRLNFLASDIDIKYDRKYPIGIGQVWWAHNNHRYKLPPHRPEELRVRSHGRADLLQKLGASVTTVEWNEVQASQNGLATIYHQDDPYNPNFTKRI